LGCSVCADAGGLASLPVNSRTQHASIARSTVRMSISQKMLSNALDNLAQRVAMLDEGRGYYSRPVD
jgi:hypothetical protein